MNHHPIFVHLKMLYPFVSLDNTNNSAEFFLNSLDEGKDSIKIHMEVESEHPLNITVNCHYHLGYVQRADLVDRLFAALKRPLNACDFDVQYVEGILVLETALGEAALQACRSQEERVDVVQDFLALIPGIVFTIHALYKMCETGEVAQKIAYSDLAQLVTCEASGPHTH